MLKQQTYTDFESLYLSLRRKEQRVYTDEEVMRLPTVPVSNPHSKEWQIRKKSMFRILNWIKSKKRKLSILEIGCGNGWLSSQIAHLNHTEVTGTDINRLELMQAKRVFGNKKNLHFHFGNLETLADKKYDLIFFAASIQYFESLKDILHDALTHLNENGEIHILDTYLYQDWETEVASKRSSIYYHSQGFDEMSNFYFHHSREQLIGFNYRFLFNPSSLKNKLFNRQDPFPWICIQPQ